MEDLRIDRGIAECAISREQETVNGLEQNKAFYSGFAVRGLFEKGGLRKTRAAPLSSIVRGDPPLMTSTETKKRAIGFVRGEIKISAYVLMPDLTLRFSSNDSCDVSWLAFDRKAGLVASCRCD